MPKADVAESVALKEKIANDSSRIVAEIRAEIGELEGEYIEARKEQKLGILLIVVTFMSAHLLAFISGSTFLILIFIAIFIYSLYIGFRLFFGKFRIIKQYNFSVNNIIFAKAFSLLGLDGKVAVTEEGMIKKSPDGTSWQEFLKSLRNAESIELVHALADLDSSELITEPHNTNQVDNILEINYKDSSLKLAELDIKHVTGSGKNRTTKQIFHGYFVAFDLNRELAGKTFVSTEGDRLGFGNLSFFGDFSQSQVKETVLEWNEFENLLHVATTDEIEARYILTPNFMQDLYSWWQGRNTNIRLSFIKNRLFILYPDNKIRLNQTVEKITDENIAEYIYTIAWPLQNVIKLIDDIRL